MNEISPFFDNRRSNDNGSAHARRALTPNKTVGMTPDLTSFKLKV
ncbi:hypothetical protein QG034_08995 [Kingella kingae]|nr:hypothetical protein [Kingella kingae]MDK4526997.1 hypothetical protein [Kingella kingae]MDK4533074.1 hypothetical protein [Kingella kingae]MDK4536349.1 hypothetical protein [Kingella kingae]MDK4623432.1 hypothetical protein [Kingella kingae]